LYQGSNIILAIAYPIGFSLAQKPTKLEALFHFRHKKLALKTKNLPQPFLAGGGNTTSQ